MDDVYKLYTERIKDDFRSYCHDNYKDYMDEHKFCEHEIVWEDFKEKAIQDLYNSGITEPFCESYYHLVFFLGMCIPQSEWFIDWNEPQKVYELGLYLLAEEYIMGLDIPEESEEESEEEIQPQQ